jgi:ribosomal protein S18 acetylase RimI-like enzyme
VKNRIIRKNSLLRLFFARIRKQRILLVAKTEGKCVGLIISSCNANIGVIHWLFVLPEYRGKKIGFNLIKKAEAELQKLGCHKITLTTEIAPEFYKNLGYIEEGLLKKHWWQKDFTIMSKILNESVSLIS